MAYTIYLGTFSKHENSTAQPTYTGWASFDVTLKEGADISAPELTISASLSTVIDFNYAVMLGRYYWIRRKNALRNGFIVMQLEIDVLATYKTEIGSSNLYILRSSAASDEYIMDNYYPMTGDITYSPVYLDAFPTTTFSGGYYVINCAGTNTGASTLYQLSPASFTTLVNQLLGVVDSFTPVDVIEAVKNTLFNPMDYINSVMWFPDAFGTSGTQNVTIGRWASGVTASVISSTAKSLYNSTITLPKHPKASTRGKYLNLSPYSQYYLECDPFGVVTLDSSQLADETGLIIDVWMDAMTGQGVLKVRGATGTACLASITSQIGVPVSITMAGANISAVTSTAATIGAMAIAPVSTAMIGAAAAGIDSAASAIRGCVATIGSNGGTLALQLPKALVGIFYDIVDEDNTHNGRPYCKVTTPANLTGYMIAQHGDVEIAAPLPELDMIRGFLESGFYYE